VYKDVACEDFIGEENFILNIENFVEDMKDLLDGWIFSIEDMKNFMGYMEISLEI
jgi:hypothetical protein